MHIVTFIQDLAIIMMVAAIVTIIFHQLKQPVVLGYIISGLILGRHTPPFSFIHDENIIKILAEFGVIFLMFSLGLEFSIRKLIQVGSAAIVAALAEIILMIIVGYQLGHLFGWTDIDSLFLGAMLAISSTTIIIKALNELGLKQESFAQIIFGILIVEDILAIAILAILPSIALSGTLNLTELVMTVGKLFVFLVASVVIGFLFVPKCLTYVTRFKSKEMLLITVLGLCFGYSLIVIKLGYSVALGAFLIGAIMAESRQIKSIEKLIEPLTNMFSAIFFVSIGLMVDPLIMYQYALPILIITIVLVIAKIVVCSLGVFMAGRDARTSMRVGMGLAQIGEFSFIIASLGISLNVMSPYLYPIIVAVSAITTFLTPYLIKLADPFTLIIHKIIPHDIRRIFNSYTRWLQNMSRGNKVDPDNLAIKSNLLYLFINMVLITGIFMLGSYVAHDIMLRQLLANDVRIAYAIIWGASLITSLPFLIAIHSRLKDLSMNLAIKLLKTKMARKKQRKIPHRMAEIIQYASMLFIALLIILFSASILPPIELLIVVLAIVVLLTVLLRQWLINIYNKLHLNLLRTWHKKKRRK